jgi:hypothetical protein
LLRTIWELQVLSQADRRKHCKEHSVEPWWRFSRTKHPTQSMLIQHPDWLRSPRTSLAVQPPVFD